MYDKGCGVHDDPVQWALHQLDMITSTLIVNCIHEVHQWKLDGENIHVVCWCEEDTAR